MSIVLTEDRGAVRHIVLNRPEKRNAMNQELLLALGERPARGRADPAVHCVVLRGEGPVFSAGVDLGELAASAGEGRRLWRPFRQVFLDCPNLCEEMAKPVICQIHRTCVGGALEVALGCDLRIASSDAQLGLPEVRFGIIPDVGGSTRLPAVVGLGRAKELIMTARTIDAEEAERIGLVNRVVAPEELKEATEVLVDELLANSHVAVGPRQARDRRLRPSRPRPDARPGGRRPGVLRGRRPRAPCASRPPPTPSRRPRPIVRLEDPSPRRPLGAQRAVDGTGDQRVAAQRAPQDLLGAPRAGQQRIQVHTRPRSPSPASIDTRSSLAMFPVAPAGTGQPPSSPKLDSKLSTPASSAASTLARPCPARVVEVGGQLQLIAQPGPRGGEQLAHLERVGHPRGVAEAHLPGARVAQPPPRSRTPARPGTWPS